VTDAQIAEKSHEVRGNMSSKRRKLLLVSMLMPNVRQRKKSVSAFGNKPLLLC
jgi:hypothetical protein